ncbi:MAG: hypothetical protein K2O88_10130 [Paramuribaculum sp.]|nr:hypothetical protein [Paramuribaculum sp.]
MQSTNNPKLQNQINAGTIGRKTGHRYEEELTNRLNAMPMPYKSAIVTMGIINTGQPHIILLEKVLKYVDWDYVDKVEAYATGILATSEHGMKNIEIDGIPIKSSKSDVILILYKGDKSINIGVSVKQCNTSKPTNAQIFFTTASAFYNLLTTNGIELSTDALKSMRQFCGDNGYRPLDDMDCSNRMSNPERYFWEETDNKGLKEWESAFHIHQDTITRLIMQKGYANDPFPPQIIFHKTKKADNVNQQEIAIFSIDEFLELSRKYMGFNCDKYRVKKGRYKEPVEICHHAPRFGVIQMQRGGQKQHPTQLQFNLKAGYFYLLAKL